MPITKGAIRKLRADRTKKANNLKVKAKYKSAVSVMRKKPNSKNLTQVFSSVDRAVKVHALHKNTAARLKSRLSALLVK